MVTACATRGWEKVVPSEKTVGRQTIFYLNTDGLAARRKRRRQSANAAKRRITLCATGASFFDAVFLVAHAVVPHAQLRESHGVDGRRAALK